MWIDEDLTWIKCKNKIRIEGEWWQWDENKKRLKVYNRNKKEQEGVRERKEEEGIESVQKMGG